MLAYAGYLVMDKLKKAGGRRKVPEPKGPQKKSTLGRVMCLIIFFVEYLVVEERAQAGTRF